MVSSSEKVFFEGSPAREDLIFNILAGFTLVGLPFTFGAVVRALWLRFKITNKRVSVTGGWLGKNKTQIVYKQIKEVRSIPRGFGSYGDMVLVTKDGARLEMRCLPNFREVASYIEEQISKTNSNQTSNGVIGF